MKLFEFEGKEIFRKFGIKTPDFFLLESLDQVDKIPKNLFPAVLKAQLLSGNRAKRGGIIEVVEKKDIDKRLKSLWNKQIDGEKVKKILIEKKVEIQKEYYFSVTYDTSIRSAVLLFSSKAGTGIESENEINIHPLVRLDSFNVERFLDGLSDVPLWGKNFPEEERNDLREIVRKMVDLFFGYDARLVEINPLVKTKDGPLRKSPKANLAFSGRSEASFIALDSKIILDDSALYRHPDLNLPSRTDGKEPTKAEIEAKKIDQNDHRGVAGSTYFDLDGDIAILASGGGGSLVALDGVLSAGGKPANYTEYSGNPPKEKVKKLASIVLSKKGLKGLLIAGAIANFTDIKETLSGVLEVLIEKKPSYPIVIRRAGPNDKAAHEILKSAAKEHKLNIYLFGEEMPIDGAARLIVKLVKEFK